MHAFDQWVIAGEMVKMSVKTSVAAFYGTLLQFLGGGSGCLFGVTVDRSNDLELLLICIYTMSECE